MHKNPYRGTFIVLEGSAGSGKTLQAEMLVASLRNRGKKAVYTHEPTEDGAVSRKIREVLDHRVEMEPEALQELMSEDRREHSERVIVPALKDGTAVVADRYFFSSFAYGGLKGVPPERIAAMNADCILPDLALALIADPRVCMERIRSRAAGEGADTEVVETEEKLAKVVQSYRSLAERFPDLVFVDANRTPEEIHAEVAAAVKGVIE